MAMKHLPLILLLLLCACGLTEAQVETLKQSVAADLAREVAAVYEERATDKIDAAEADRRIEQLEAAAQQRLEQLLSERGGPDLGRIAETLGTLLGSTLLALGYVRYARGPAKPVSKQGARKLQEMAEA